MTNRFISVHALGFMWFNMIHMTNWVINGLPVRFPKLKVMWIESGLTWAASLMQRLDHSFMMRTSDAPLLKEKPSHYMQQMFYSTQPMEIPDDKSVMQSTFKMINAETQLVWSSDYPHWDFDLPSTIYDLPFLNETSKRNILGANAARLFNLDPKPVKKNSESRVMPGRIDVGCGIDACNATGCAESRPCSTSSPQRTISASTNLLNSSGGGEICGIAPSADEQLLHLGLAHHRANLGGELVDDRPSARPRSSRSSATTPCCSSGYRPRRAAARPAAPATRSSVVTPSARTLPPSISALAGGASANMNCTWPPTTSCKRRRACPCTARAPHRCRRCS